MAIRRIGVDGTVSRQSVDLLGNRRGEVQGFNVVERDDLRIGDDLDYLGRPAVVEVVDTEDLAQLHFMQSEIGLDGIIRDETPGRGTDRPELIGRCVNFDGTNDKATLPAFTTTGNLTVSFWLNTAQVTSGQLLNLASSGITDALVVGIYNNRKILASNQSAVIATSKESAVAIDSSGWVHIVVTKQSSAIQNIFINGVDSTQAAGASWGFGAQNVLGVSPSNTTPYQGKLWDLQVFGSVLTASEVYQLYSLCEFALPNTPRVAWYNCESQNPTLLLDSSGNERHATCSSHNATVGNFFYEGSDVPGNYANKVGYTLSNGSSHYAYSNGTGLIAAGVVIPRNEANQTACAAYTAAGAAVALDNVGEAPKHAKLQNSNCGTFDGSDDYLAVAHLTGTETVVRSGGTSTPTVSAGRIDFTAGTCWDLLLSSGDWFPFSEGKGTTVHNVLPDRGHATANEINEITFWGTKQNSFAYNGSKGSSFSSGTYIPAQSDQSGLDALGNPLTYAPVTGTMPLSESTLNTNPNSAPRRGTAGPTAFHPVSAPGSNPTFFRRRTKNSELVAIDRFAHYEETLDGARLTKAQTFTTEKPL